MPSLSAHITVATGYGNTEATPSDLRKLYRELRGMYVSPEVSVQLLSYNDNWKAHAYAVHQDCRDDAYIGFIGHSYSGGYGFQRFAKHLLECGRTLACGYVIDGVIRPFRFFLPGNIIALTRIGQIRITCNVKKVVSWRQVNESPYGRHVASCKTSVIEHYCFGAQSLLEKHAYKDEIRIVDPSMTHESIDNDWRVWQRITEDMAAVIQHPGGRHDSGTTRTKGRGSVS